MIAWFLLGSAIAYGLVLTVYRLHVHPLSRFPGPRLAALTGLYELIYTAWGAGSFDDEIDRMHRIYGPVVRITPDEVHVQEQFYNPNYAEGWIKGTEVLDAGRDQLRDTTKSFHIRNQVRSILQIEVRQIIRGLVRKHQVHRVFSSRIRSFIPITELRGPQTDHTEGSDLENGSPTALLSARGRSMSRSSQECKGPLPTSGNTGPRLWYP